MYLIFTTKEEAISRADQEGELVGYSYWKDGLGTRWKTSPDPTAEGDWALDVTEYTLSSEEQSQTVSSYNYSPEDHPEAEE